MNAAEIREYIEEHFQKGTLKHELAEFRLLGEIAAQLAEMNDRAEPDRGWSAAREIGRAYKKLRAAADEMAVVLAAVPINYPPGESAIEKWKAARGD